MHQQSVADAGRPHAGARNPLVSPGQIAAGALGTDILKVVEAQPALLLQQASPLDDEVRHADCLTPTSF